MKIRPLIGRRIRIGKRLHVNWPSLQPFSNERWEGALLLRLDSASVYLKFTVRFSTLLDTLKVYMNKCLFVVYFDCHHQTTFKEL